MPTHAHLRARPGSVTTPAPAGLHKLGLGGKRDSYLYVPPHYTPARPMPLVLLLHGAGGHAHDGIRVLLHLAEHHDLILVAPASHGSSWDIISSRRYGPDRDLADLALAHVFGQYAIDPAHIGIGGFSDGASYALSLGLANGDLFTHVLAFSPGFVGPMTARGAPKVFIAHGTGDDILPIDACSRNIVPKLEAAGYAVVYDEFDGRHEIPPQVAQFAVHWFLDRSD
jgi:predicted esterase